MALHLPMPFRFMTIYSHWQCHWQWQWRFYHELDWRRRKKMFVKSFFGSARLMFSIEAQWILWRSNKKLYRFWLAHTAPCIETQKLFSNSRILNRFGQSQTSKQMMWASKEQEKQVARKIRSKFNVMDKIYCWALCLCL